jgi:hypothetical protein
VLSLELPCCNRASVAAVVRKLVRPAAAEAAAPLGIHPQRILAALDSAALMKNAVARQANGTELAPAIYVVTQSHDDAPGSTGVADDRLRCRDEQIVCTVQISNCVCEAHAALLWIRWW